MALESLYIWLFAFVCLTKTTERYHDIFSGIANKSHALPAKQHTLCCKKIKNTQQTPPNSTQHPFPFLVGFNLVGLKSSINPSPAPLPLAAAVAVAAAPALLLGGAGLLFPPPSLEPLSSQSRIRLLVLVLLLVLLLGPPILRQFSLLQCGHTAALYITRLPRNLRPRPRRSVGFSSCGLPRRVRLI